jgi:hypothetical protein
MAAGQDVLDWLGDKLDFVGNLRYGMSTSEKERIARAGTLPGAPPSRPSNDEISDRYAAGYLFGDTYPRAAPLLMPAINALKTSSVPFFGGSSPELQDNATAGMVRAIQEKMVAESRSRPDPSSLVAFTAGDQSAALRRPSPTPMPAPPPPSSSSFRR